MKDDKMQVGSLSPSMFKKLDILDSVDSTNEYLKGWIEQRQPRAALALAQSAGRGRHGSFWESSAGEGLYASYLFFPNWPQSRAPALNMIAALALRQALIDFDPKIGRQLRFKEPNDVLLDGKKVAGILVELGSLGEVVQWAIVGVGVNLSQQRFQIEKPKVQPTSLLLAGRKPPRAVELFDALTTELSRLCQRVDRGDQSRIEREFEAHVAERISR